MDLAEQPLGFLTLKKFLEYFPPLKITRENFIKNFTVSYRKPITLEQIYTNPPGPLNPILRKPNDVRWIKQDELIDYFYDIVIINREKYLTHFYHSFFDFKDPFSLQWLDGPNIGSTSTGSTKKNALNLTKDEEQAGISMQKNDASRRMIRNLFYKDILDYTRITNSVKSRVSFWQTFDNLYNHLILEDRFFAPSSIDLFLKDKRGVDRTISGSTEANFVTLYYLIQNYQPKASILNPYTIFWILQNLLPPPIKLKNISTRNGNGNGKIPVNISHKITTGRRIFTPVLSWSSYLTAFMHLPSVSTAASFSNDHVDEDHYVGVDVIPRVCAKTRYLADWYQSNFPNETKNKRVDIYCQPSESLLNDTVFMKTYKNYFDTVLLCPPYFDMEIYKGGDQSVDLYPDYQQWLKQYWEATVKLSQHVLQKGGWFAYIINDYYDLDKNFYPLTQDLANISQKYFKLQSIYTLYNRTSPLRANHKDRSEKLYIFKA